MKRSVLAPLAALMLTSAPLTESYAASTCFTPAEATAVEVRMLQSELMVAALACRDSNPELGMVAQYNDFVHRLGDRLVSHSRVLQAHFKKYYGTGGTHRLEAFVTALANDASKRSMTESGYCHSAAGLFSEVSTLPRNDLEMFSAAHAGDIGAHVDVCGGTETAAAGKIIRR